MHNKDIKLLSNQERKARNYQISGEIMIKDEEMAFEIDEMTKRRKV